MFNKILTWLRDWIDKMISTKEIESISSAEVVYSQEMVTALETWSDMYADQADWLSDEKEVYSLGLPAAIAAVVS